MELTRIRDLMLNNGLAKSNLHSCQKNSQLAPNNLEARSAVTRSAQLGQTATSHRSVDEMAEAVPTDGEGIPTMDEDEQRRTSEQGGDLGHEEGGEQFFTCNTLLCDKTGGNCCI